MSVPQPIAPAEPTSVSGSSTPGGLELAPSTTISQASGVNQTTEPSTNAVTTGGETPRSRFGLNKMDQAIVGVFVAGFLLLSGYHWATLGGWGLRPIELERLPERQYDFRIDINSASWVEWTQIEGIGEATANKIVADRDSNGPFRSIDDLLRVKGIGPKTLEKMRPFLRESRSNSADAEPSR